jgi:dienelactone hydrolase
MAQTSQPSEPTSATDSQTTEAVAGARIHRVIGYGNGEVIEQVQLPGHEEITVHINYRKDAPRPMPVLLGYPNLREKKVGELMKDAEPTTRPVLGESLPAVSGVGQKFLEHGGALVNFINSKPAEHPWPEGKARWVWPTPDPAGAEAWAQAAMYAPGDFGTVIDYVQSRTDLRRDRIGYIGGSTTAMIGYGLISKEPRVTCAVLCAGSGDFAGFNEGWARNYDWKSKGFEVWEETRAKLREHDPILFVDRIYPRALLMLNGGKDRIIPVESARHYFEALYPHYAADPDRLQMIVFEGAGHGWDQEWNDEIITDWLDRYLIRETPPTPHPRPETK